MDYRKDGLRIIFKDNSQKKFFHQISLYYGKNWANKLSKELNRSLPRIYDYSNGRSKISKKQLGILCKSLKINKSQISPIIKEIEPTWGCVKGALVTNQRHKKKLSEWGRKGAYRIQELYPDQRLKWIEKGIKKAGKIGSSVQLPTMLEKRVIRKLNDFDYELHKTIEKKSEYFNIDLLINSIPIEILSSPHSKGNMFFKILEIKHKSHILKKRFFIIVEDYKDYPDAILLSIEDGIIPVSLEYLKILKSYLATKNKTYIKKLIKIAESESTRFIRGNYNQTYGAAKRELLRYNNTERIVSKLLNYLDLEGKVMLKSKFSTFTIPDNHFNLGKNQYFIFISSVKDVRHALRNHVGYSYMIKRIYNRNYKTFSIILTNKPMRIKSGRLFRFYKKYVDLNYIGSLSDLLEDTHKLTFK